MHFNAGPQPDLSLEWISTGKALGPQAGQCHHPPRVACVFALRPRRLA